MTTKNVKTTEKLGRFAALEAEAMEGVVVVDPYVIDDVEPPIVITEPTDSERVIAFAKLYAANRDKTGRLSSVKPEDFEPLLKSICGDAYDRVWNELLRGKHFRVTRAFLDDVQNYFQKATEAAQAAAKAAKGE